MDVTKVYAAAGEAIQRARDGGGPSLLECKTYRFMGHSRFEPSNYRTKEELAEWKKRDPITCMAGLLRGELDATDAELSAVDEDAQRLMEEAVRFAEQSADPAPDDWRRYIYAG